MKSEHTFDGIITEAIIWLRKRSAREQAAIEAERGKALEKPDNQKTQKAGPLGEEGTAIC